MPPDPAEERKFNVFLLASDAFHQQRHSLSLTSDSKVKDIEVVRDFNSTIESFFFKTDATTFDQAVDNIVRKLRVQAEDLRSRPAFQCAEVLVKCCDDIEQRKSTWDYHAYLHNLQLEAQQYALSFYDHLTMLDLKRTPVTVQCEFSCSGYLPTARYDHTCSAIKLGFCFKPLPSHPHTSYHEWHLGCLTIFLHEYLSHIISVYDSCPTFDDGWMIVAARRHLERCYHQRPAESSLTLYQVEAAKSFVNWAVPDTDILKSARTAALFADWLELEASGDQFWSFTYHLCAMAADPDKKLVKRRFRRIFPHLRVGLQDRDATPRILSALRIGPGALTSMLEMAEVSNEREPRLLLRG